MKRSASEFEEEEVDVWAVRPEDIVVDFANDNADSLHNWVEHYTKIGVITKCDECGQYRTVFREESQKRVKSKCENECGNECDEKSDNETKI